MGKKKAQQKKKTKTVPELYPTVSVCTPTFNRRPFIKNMFRCFLHQTYPKSRLEWIIIDDGTDKIEDMINESGIPQIKYFKYDTKMTLGKKRNLMHEKATGSIIVYMDDDDYYPPKRIEHAVDTLKRNPKALCVGSSVIHVHFKHVNKIIEFGPYGPNHATAGTFAFRRQLLDETRYNEEAALAEEKEFLKNYTIPFAQLNPRHTILVFSHEHNTFDKRKLLDNPNPKVTKDADYVVDDFVKEEDIKKFFMEEIDEMLKNYEAGEPKMKPDVLKQLDEITARRDKMMKDAQEQQAQSGSQPSMISINENGKPRQLSNNEVVQLLQTKENTINTFSESNKKLQEERLIMEEKLRLLSQKLLNTQNNTNNDSLDTSLLEILKKQPAPITPVMPPPQELPKINMTLPSGERKVLSMEDTVKLLERYHNENNHLKTKLSGNESELRLLREKLHGKDNESESLQQPTHANETDIQLIMSQVNCTREKAIEAYEISNGDIVESIMHITS
jgi:glycosyltransferase involved in cell wall biosynthesis/NACalpha-BTF3-like transcription factor